MQAKVPSVKRIRMHCASLARFLLLIAAPILSPLLRAQTRVNPIAIVPLDTDNPNSAASVTGALSITKGKAIIASNGTITSGSQTTAVTLPRRGILRVCAFTTVKLAADSSVPAGETPGLMMALNHGAVEMSFATGRNSDILLTPDFRILVGGPGAADVKVRLGQHGDTCVDNSMVSSSASANAPYVLVTSVFDDSDYRVQPGQRVMFEDGSLHEVVDQEKEPCGCPPPLRPGSNDFPLAQSEGMVPNPTPTSSFTVVNGTVAGDPLSYNAADHGAQADEASQTQTTDDPNANAKPKKAKKKHSHSVIADFFDSIGHFFRHLFGAE
ncbi:MAG: hypothetical protein ABSE51_10000 [Terracidiphilus sp.]|jgi:hypothetical protein